MRGNAMKTNIKEITFDTVVCRNKEISEVDFDGEFAIMNERTGVYYYMDAIGSKIWRLILHPVTTNEIAEQLITQYEVDPETCREHVREFIADLIDRELVEHS